MKKAYRILIRILVFIGIYIPLFTIPHYLGSSSLVPVVVFIAYILSIPLAKAVISKWFPVLKN
jgi:hypothetical protein